MEKFSCRDDASACVRVYINVCVCVRARAFVYVYVWEASRGACGKRAGPGGRSYGYRADEAELTVERDRRALLWVWTVHAAFPAFVFVLSRRLSRSLVRPLDSENLFPRPSVSLFSLTPPPYPRSLCLFSTVPPVLGHATGIHPAKPPPQDYRGIYIYIYINELWIKFDLVSGRGGHPSVDPFLPPAHTAQFSAARVSPPHTRYPTYVPVVYRRGKYWKTKNYNVPPPHTHSPGYIVSGNFVGRRTSCRRIDSNVRGTHRDTFLTPWSYGKNYGLKTDAREFYFSTRRTITRLTKYPGGRERQGRTWEGIFSSRNFV